ncbi:MAG: CoA-binding protein [Nanoarchaeota archaeon]|nr:CoA-binding protein [Nanoarchaeota archaeon]MBU4452322.1 CoA-binding protein [Nanoarchaeota archaeon]MCG2724554.1 CoA-binding protein [archaeon]
MSQASSSLASFFTPRTIAVVGASPDEKKLGGIIFKNLMHGAARGNLYPINIHEKKIHGIKCFVSIEKLPVSPDLAVIAVHASDVGGVLRQCVKKKVKAVVVISAGFRETGVNGAIREQELKEIIKGSSTRIIGPNCMGVYDAHSKLNMLFVSPVKFSTPVAGDISIISQSGAVGTAILDYMASRGIGVSKFVSYGNRADVDESELLQYLLADSKTKAILCYVEGLKDGRRFYEILKKSKSSSNSKIRKPVIILKAGKHEGSAKAAVSHTGSLTGNYRVFGAAMKQAGAICAKTIEELTDFGKAAAYETKADKKEHPRIAIVTNGGGFGVMCADMCLSHGMQLAEFSDATRHKVKSVMPDFSEINNPLDLIGDAASERFEAALDAVIKDENVDGIAVFVWHLGISLDDYIANAIISAKRRTQKPFVAGAFGGKYAAAVLKYLESQKIPAYPTPRRALKALEVLAKK